MVCVGCKVMTGLEIALLSLAAFYGAKRIYRELLVPLWHFMKKAVYVTDLMAAIPERLAELEKRTKQLTPNGGTHLHDDIRETRRLLEQHVQDAVTWKTDLSHRVMALEDRN
jgi:hypothetical protein